VFNNKTLSIYHIPLLIMFLSFIVFFITAFCVVNIDAVAVFDLSVVKSVNTFSSKHPLDMPVFITDLGDRYGMVYPVIFALGTFIYFNRFKEPLLLIMATESAHIITKITKNLFHIPRPPAELNLVDPHGFSFPSGHSMVSMVFYGLLVYFCFKYIKNVWIKMSSIFILVLLVILIGLSRIYLGVHYPSDVIGGFSLGLFWISMWIILFKLYEKRTAKYNLN